MAVIGPGPGATPEQESIAREVGAGLAAAGCIVLTGGLGGVMAAATDGARAAGGRTVALLPGADRAGSAAADIVLPTGLGEARNVLLVRAADVVVAVGGSWGTLSELALARRLARPAVAIGGWAVSAADGSEQPLAGVVDDAAEAVAAVLGLLPDPTE